MSDAFTSDTYEALCKEAEDYLSRGLAEQARELLLKAISLIGTRPKARSLLADCCMSLGLWSEARAQLETLTTLEVGSPSHHFRLGQVMEEMGEYAMARDNYSVVLEHEPDNHAAQVALNRLKDRPDSAEPEGEAEEEAAEPEEAVRRSGDVQVYPDDESEEGVFASASEDEVEKLLKDIGVAPSEVEGEDGTDVAELLSSMGIDLGDSPKKKRQQTKDISEILGGEGGRQAEAEEEEAAGAETPAEEEAQQAEETQEGPSLDAIFGGPPEEPEEPQAAAEDEEEEEGETSLEAIFGGDEEEEPKEEPEEEEAGEEAATSLEAIFGGTAAPEQEEAEGEKAPEEEEAEAKEPPPEAVEEEQAEEEPAAEEEEEPAEEEAGPSLAAIFGGTAAPEQEEAEGEKAPEEEEPEEEPASEEEEEPEEEKAGPSLAAIFGGAGTEAGEEEPEEAAEEEAEAEDKKAGPSLSAIFGGGPGKKEEAGEAGEEPEEAEEAGDEAPDAEEAGEEPEEAEEAGEEPEEAGEKTEEPSAEEVPQPEEEPAEEEAPAGRKAGIVCHRPAPESVAVVYLEDVELIVEPGFLAAADGSLEASDEDGMTLLRGSGRAWIGDGAAVPVSLSVSDGLRVRPDRLALRQSSVELEEADGNGLAGVGGEGSLALLAGGRFRWLSCTGGDGCLRISGESIVAVEGDVELEPAEDAGEGFLLASGEGRVLISC